MYLWLTSFVPFSSQWRGRAVSRRKLKIMRQILANVTDDHHRGYVLLYPDGMLELLNETARTYLCPQNSKMETVLTLDTIHRDSPELTSFLRQLENTCLERRQKKNIIIRKEPLCECLAIASPISVRPRKRTHWLVELNSQITQGESPIDPAWALMIQRMAHDLKNPLTSILLIQQRLQIEYRKNAPALASTLDPYIEQTIKSVGHLRRITTDFLKLIDAEERQRVETDVTRFVLDQADFLSSITPPDISLEIEPTDGLPQIYLDRDQIRSVLENLVSNAVNAMMDGGVITISAHLATDMLFPEEVHAQDYVVLSVRDTGIGMDEEIRQRALEPGFTETDGTGVGLTIVRKIVADHDGRLEIESEPGTGSTFSIFFPRVTIL